MGNPVDFWGYNDTGSVEPALVLSGTSVSAGAARSGASGLWINGSSGTATFFPTTTTSSPIFGFAFQAASYSSGKLWRFSEGGTIHFAVGVDATGHLTIYGAAGTVVATAATALIANVWQYIEIVGVTADVGGTVSVYVDDALAVTYTGDTKNGLTGVIDTVTAARASTAFFMDDTYLLSAAGSAPFNTRLKDIVVRTLLPNGNGASSDFTGSDGNSTDNYLLVDDPAANTTDYVSATVAGKTDLYTLQDIPATDLPLAIQTVIYANKSDGGTPPVLKMVVKGDGGTVVEQSSVTLSTTFQTFGSAVRTTDPDGDALSATNVNGMQAGVRTA